MFFFSSILLVYTVFSSFFVFFKLILGVLASLERAISSYLVHFADHFERSSRRILLHPRKQRSFRVVRMPSSPMSLTLSLLAHSRMAVLSFRPESRPAAGQSRSNHLLKFCGALPLRSRTSPRAPSTRPPRREIRMESMNH